MFQLIQVLYWLSLSTWFGGVLFVAIAAPVIFRTIGEADPTLPKVLSVNLEGQHGTLLAGSIVANLLSILVPIQLVCAAVLLVTLIGQWFLIDRFGQHLVTASLRTTMYVAATALLLYNRLVVWPRVKNFRQEYIDHADEPDVANAAKDRFDRYHNESVFVLQFVLFLLLGMIIFSGNIRMHSVSYPFAH